MLTFTVFAEDTVVDSTEPVDTSVSDDAGYSAAYDALYAQIKRFADSGYEVRVVYTSDSVRTSGLIVEPYVDALKLDVGVKISSNLESGVKIYDDPSTEIIDGIRIDGAEITTYTPSLDFSKSQDIVVAVKLVYTDDLFGTFAKVSDGNYNYAELLQDPLMLIQILYYGIAAISLIVGGLGVLFSKKKKVKSADEIASKVEAKAKAGYDELKVLVAEVLQNQLAPILNSAVNSNKAVVKAITLSTSKSKEAPVALLDILQQVSDIDTSKIIDEAREQVLKNIADVDAKRELTRTILSQIANGTYQEVSDEAVTDQQSSGEPELETKSVL